jgi:hypothetical protein
METRPTPARQPLPPVAGLTRCAAVPQGCQTQELCPPPMSHRHRAAAAKEPQQVSVRGGSGGWRLQALACCPQHRLPCSRRTHTRRVASSGKLWQHCDACFGPCWALHTSSIFVRSCLLWEAATWELSLGLAQHLPMLSFDSPSPPQRSRPAAAARSAPICWSASPMAPQPHLPPSPAVAASSVAGRLPAGNLLPVEVVQVILRARCGTCALQHQWLLQFPKPSAAQQH